MNFKGVQTLWEKSDKFTKILSQYDLHKSEFSWAHLFVKIGVLTQASKWIASKIRNELEFEIPTTRHLQYNQTSLEFHSSFNTTL
jgi:hypothetical protein